MIYTNPSRVMNGNIRTFLFISRRGARFSRIFIDFGQNYSYLLLDYNVYIIAGLSKFEALVT